MIIDLSTHGRIGPEADKFNKRLSVLRSYSEAVSFVRTQNETSVQHPPHSADGFKRIQRKLGDERR